MVDVSKAYCPDCGSPMDEEQKRIGSSEYDSFMKTQQISKTTQFKLSEYFNQSVNSDLPQSDTSQPNEVGNERKSVVLNLQPIAPFNDAVPKQSETVASQTESKLNQPAAKGDFIDSSSKSSKKIPIVAGGVILFIFLVFVAAVVITGILYWNYLK